MAAATQGLIDQILGGRVAPCERTLPETPRYVALVGYVKPRGQNVCRWIEEPIPNGGGFWKGRLWVNGSQYTVRYGRIRETGQPVVQFRDEWGSERSVMFMIDGEWIEHCGNEFFVRAMKAALGWLQRNPNGKSLDDWWATAEF